MDLLAEWLDDGYSGDGIFSDANDAVEGFVERVWTHRPLVRHRKRPLAFADVLSLDDIDALLWRTRLPTPAELLVFKSLAATDEYSTPHSAFADGASLIINHADKIWAPLNRLCTELGSVFRHTYANVYLTPHASQTAPLHADDRDVFVLQLHGAKAWRLWQAPAWAERLPFGNEQLGKGSGPLTEAELGPPVLSMQLEAGDVLYIPRGAPHVAETRSPTGNHCSLHATIAIPTADLNYHGCIMQAAAEACSGLLHFRRALPLGPRPSVLGPGETTTCTAAPATAPASAAPPSSDVDVVPLPVTPSDRHSSDMAVIAKVRERADECEAVSAASSKAAAAPEPATAAADDRTAHWRRTYFALWDEVRRSVDAASAISTLRQKTLRHAEVQRDSIARVEASVASLPPALYSHSVLLKQSGLQIIVQQRPSAPSALGAKGDSGVTDQDLEELVVAQGRPPAGSGLPQRYAFVPRELREAMSQFEGVPVGGTVSVGELAARHAFLQVCAARLLMQIAVAAAPVDS